MKPYWFIAMCGLLFIGCTNESPQRGGERDTPPDSTFVPSAGLPDSSTYERASSSMGQLIYIPVYSHIYQQDRQKTFNLTATLSIRNVDPFRTLRLRKVAYYDSGGQLIQHYLEESIQLEPLSSTSFVVEERDLRGGVGANFLVRWIAENEVNPPIVEAVMISTSQQQGISFISEGRVIEEY
ncbi:DUF3124 domain-containing protein [Fodinibius salsisoli]|uniref:DUF3124 domain-containing protein n=1 Tax=Fodinibius salsisoli TaxID=2820877 RepID=A0ABT3PI61_9BACT|nr:DUF3124 domain-containing protein [Fodinibius salsisoli]MCW9705621.1 DUF3124 domain-containing protein [Fodinibius salsisoli]